MATDAEIITLLRERADEGLRLFLREHGGRVRVALRRLFPDHTDATDHGLSEALQRLWERPECYNPAKGSLVYYVTKIAMNATRTHLRQRLTTSPLVDTVPAPSEHTPESSPRASALLRRLREACADLSELQQEIVRADMQCGGSLPAGELAERLGVSANLISVNRHRARAKLSSMLGIELEGDRR